MTPTVLTLLAGPTQTALSSTLAEAFADLLKQNGVTITEQQWLCEGEAYDFILSTPVPVEVQEVLHHAACVCDIDAIVQPVSHRRKRLFIADMDSTMITIECIDELADFAGIKPQIAEITERAMNGELDFKQALTERVALLSGLQETFLQRVYDERVFFTEGARTLVKTMRAHGAVTMLVSGGFTFFTDRVSQALGFEFSRSNILDIRDGKLTGKVIEPIVDKETKLESLQRLCKDYGISHMESMAVGDGANDIPMLQAAGLGVAYRAKPHVKEQVKAQLDFADLTALLYVQGYRKEQFVDES